MGAKSKNPHFQKVIDLQLKINDIEKDLKGIGNIKDYRNPGNYHLKRNRLRQKYDVEGRFQSLDKLIEKLNSEMGAEKKIMSMKYVRDPRHFFLSDPNLETNKANKYSNTKHIGYEFNPYYNQQFDPTSEFNLEQDAKKKELQIENVPKKEENKGLTINNGNVYTDGPNNTSVLIKSKGKEVSPFGEPSTQRLIPGQEYAMANIKEKEKAPAELSWIGPALKEANTTYNKPNRQGELLIARAKDINRAYGVMNDASKQQYLSNPVTQLELEA